MNDVAQRFTVNLRKQLGVPLYTQITAVVQDLVNDGTFPSGELIPSENEISRFTGVSRMTVRRALQDLVQQGTLVPISRRKYCATPERIQLASGALRSFTREISAMGLHPSSRLISSQAVYRDPIAHVVFGKPGEVPVLKVERARCGDRVPPALEPTYYDLTICAGLERANLERSIYEFLAAQLGIVLRRATQTIQAHSLSNRESVLLEAAPRSAALKLKGTTYDRHANMVEFVEAVFRGDRYTVGMQLR